jgi:hypothetical protein
MKIIIGYLGLCDEGICDYGKKGKDGQRVLFRWPIQLGLYVIQEINENDDIRLELVKERKKYYGIAYNDDRLGMVCKFELPNVHIMPMVLEVICRKFKVSSQLSKIEKGNRKWIKNPDTVNEDDLRKFLSKRA